MSEPHGVKKSGFKEDSTMSLRALDRPDNGDILTAIDFMPRSCAFVSTEFPLG